MLTFQLYFVVFFVAVIASRILSSRALKLLSSDQKAALVDAFSGLRAYSLIPLVAIMAAYFIFMQHPVMSFQALTILYLGAFVAYIAWNFWFTRRRLLRLDLPRAYLTWIGIARGLQLAGFALLLVGLIRFV